MECDEIPSNNALPSNIFDVALDGIGTMNYHYIFVGINSQTKNYSSATDNHMFFSDEYEAVHKAYKFYKRKKIVAFTFMEHFCHTDYDMKYPEFFI